MEKYYYECESRTCGHVHESKIKSGYDNCEKCNHTKVSFSFMYKILDKKIK